ncbi:hypothetical protein SAMN04488550_2218 [Gordonia malaquae]|uniref:Uncharacterized protein n=1 Tax=Gordonia malaquae NBRC 108250 TaxID=1223542 RepID=M3UIX1_GORML|nr:hypothetical protein [Gordonia malaquae]GAC79440.1 hypothetical protein GM1_010_00290 [Gordonia malaquae NBRC 108250]SED26295.1 hypothetical protein SAMN04488550_2218 [Gordonia malaquae]
MRINLVRTARAVVMLLAAAVVGGCTVDGTPTTAPIDLDVGRYGSMLEAPLPDATSAVRWSQLRAVRLAEHMVFPRDLDAAIVDVKMPTAPIGVPRNMGAVIPDADTIPAMKRFEYGFVITAGDTPGDQASQQMIARFADPEAARDAVHQLAPLWTKPTEYVPAGEIVTLAGLPAGSIAAHLARPLKGRPTAHSTMGLTAVGEYLVYTWAESENRAWTERIVTTAYMKQKPMIDAIGPDDPSRNADPTGLMTGTLRSTEDNGNPIIRTVWGPRGIALISQNGPEAYRAVMANGVTVGVVNGSNAYRAGSPAQAARWRDYLIKEYLDRSEGVARPAASPRDLPSALCFAAGTRESACFVAVGAYVGEVEGSTLLDGQQQISAVYTALVAR